MLYHLRVPSIRRDMRYFLLGSSTRQGQSGDLYIYKGTRLKQAKTLIQIYPSNSHKISSSGKQSRAYICLIDLTISLHRVEGLVFGLGRVCWLFFFSTQIYSIFFEIRTELTGGSPVFRGLKRALKIDYRKVVRRDFQGEYIEV